MSGHAQRDIPHGGAGTSYEYYGCRCDECRDAHRRRIARRKAERAAQVKESGLPDGVEHGKSAYTNWGCRCDVCTDANKVFCRNYYYTRHHAH